MVAITRVENCGGSALVHRCARAVILGVVHGAVRHGLLLVDHVELVVQEVGVRHAVLIRWLVLMTEGRRWLDGLRSRDRVLAIAFRQRLFMVVFAQIQFYGRFYD